MDYNPDHIRLTSAEIGKLWATYAGNTMAERVLSYYLQHVNDPDIKSVLENALDLSQKIVKRIKEIFIQENFPLPIGFTKEDVNLGAPRLFADAFYLRYLKYTSKAGMSIYSIAIPLITRKDIRDFFGDTLHATVALLNEVNDLLLTKGLTVKPPFIPIPEKVDFVEKQRFLAGFFGEVRPPHAMEITHLYDNIEDDITSKALLIGFSQVAKTNEVKQLMLRGKKITNRHIMGCKEMLNRDNLPSPPLLDDQVMTSTFSPFSDKLILSHKIDMFSMKIRSYANASSLNGRRDIGAMYARFLASTGLYVEDAANVMIQHGWMEQPPLASDRTDIAKRKG
ncbi:Protein of unknown function [Lentibacillus persicus]|uniref:DUF3231 family protein n=1 Tax=Lentibacillus persicus TaxID=640948 RepID=A0A1I1S4D8_9BACI|nr:DUF3231 family protein [Lentibacillus persicus]SFD41396.1 Protein of unknown function [Lentibacillus persicus]